jgi:hypothetical protein
MAAAEVVPAVPHIDRLSQILSILQIVAAIATALRDMGLKVNGDVHINDILALIPKA